MSSPNSTTVRVCLPCHPNLRTLNLYPQSLSPSSHHFHPMGLAWAPTSIGSILTGWVGCLLYTWLSHLILTLGVTLPVHSFRGGVYGEHFVRLVYHPFWYSLSYKYLRTNSYPIYIVGFYTIYSFYYSVILFVRSSPSFSPPLYWSAQAVSPQQQPTSSRVMCLWLFFYPSAHGPIRLSADRSTSLSITALQIGIAPKRHRHPTAYR